MKTSYDRLAKIYSGHMTKMVAMSIKGFKPFKYLLLLNQKANDIGTWYVVFGCGPYQVCTNDKSELTLTYLKIIKEITWARQGLQDL